MKKNLFCALSTLVLALGLTLAFTACSDDDKNDPADKTAPFFNPNVNWGNTVDQVKSAMDGYTLTGSTADELFFNGKENVYNYTFSFDANKLWEYRVSLVPTQELKNKIEKYLKANNYKELFKEAKSRTIPEGFSRIFASSDDKTNVIFSEYLTEEGSVISRYELDFYDATKTYPVK